MGTVIVCIILAVILFFAALSLIKSKKSGGCGCGCSGCSGCTGCAASKAKPDKG